MSDHGTPSQKDVSEPLEHGLEASDHVYRWTHVALYPIQVHGIVLSSGPGMVCIADFGLSSRVPEKVGPTTEEEEKDQEAEDEDGAATSKRGSSGGGRRVAVVTFTEDEEIRQWKKVNYGGDLFSGGGLGKFFSSCLPGSPGKCDDSDGTGGAFAAAGGLHNVSDSSRAAAEGKLEREDFAEKYGPELRRLEAELSEFPDSTADDGRGERNAEITPPAHMDMCGELGSEPLPLTADGTTTDSDAADDDAVGDAQSKKQRRTPPTLPKSDPPKIVLARVRFLLEHERTDSETGQSINDVLPPYHLFHSNSECIAVWAKTGTFSTLQASVFLHSTAIGQAKTAATLAIAASSATTTLTVPAGGIMGWFGATTTVSVPLLAAQPWLIPLLAGYGVATVGTPLVLWLRARSRWSAATAELGDRFWSWAGPEVFVEAIESWSGIERPIIASS